MTEAGAGRGVIMVESVTYYVCMTECTKMSDNEFI